MKIASPAILMLAIVLAASPARTAAPVSVPKGVEKLNLKSEWNLASVTPGAGMSAPGRSLAAARLPKWNFQGVTWFARSGADLSSTAVEGTNLFVNDGAYRLKGRLRAPAGGLYVLNVGDRNYGGPANVVATDVDFDLVNDKNQGSVNVQAGSTLTVERGRFVRASVTALNANGDTNLSWVFFSRDGLNPGRDPSIHHEAIHYMSGAHQLRHFLYDMMALGEASDSPGLFIHAEAYNGPVEVALEDGVIAGTAAAKSLSPIQASSRNADVTIRLTRVAIEPGTANDRALRYLLTNRMKGKITIIAKDCVDLRTGASIDGLLNGLSK